MEPTLSQLLPVHHWLSNGKSDSQPSKRQHKLNLVEAFAQDVKRVGRRDPASKQIEPISKYKGSGLEERRRSDYLPNIRNLNVEPFTISSTKL